MNCLPLIIINKANLCYTTPKSDQNFNLKIKYPFFLFHPPNMPHAAKPERKNLFTFII